MSTEQATNTEQPKSDFPWIGELEMFGQHFKVRFDCVSPYAPHLLQGTVIKVSRGDIWAVGEMGSQFDPIYFKRLSIP